MKMASEPWKTVVKQVVHLLGQRGVGPFAAEQAGEPCIARLIAEEGAQADQLVLVGPQLEQPDLVGFEDVQSHGLELDQGVLDVKAASQRGAHMLQLLETHV